MDTMASASRSPSDQTVPEEAEVLRRFIEAIESGALLDTAPQDVAVVQRLQGELTALESAPRRARRGPGDGS
jgi:hypothetical protein